MTLADTSVWIRHFRQFDPLLAELLDHGQILCHPVVWGELACGNLKDRSSTITDLRALPQVVIATDDEVLHLITSRKLNGRGIGWADTHLLASALLSSCQLWTLDIRLQDVANFLRKGR